MISLHTAELVNTPPPPIDWLVQNIAAQRALTIMYGDPGVGKSLLSLAFAGAMTGHGIECGGFTVKRAPVIYLDAENDVDEVHRRLCMMPDSFNGQCSQYFEVFKPEKCISSFVEQYEIVENIQKFHAQLVVIDSLASSWWEDGENERLKCTQILQQLQKIARENDVGILLLHHPGHSGHMRGSTALEAVPEIVIKMGRDKRDKDPYRMFLEWEKVRGSERPNRKYLRFWPVFNGVEIEAASRPTREELWQD